MARGFELLVPGTPDEFLGALQRYGREWRESRIPPRLRAEGVYRCTVAIRGDAFELRLNRVRRGPAVLCEGRALANADGGTRVVARARITTASKVMDAVFLGGITLALGTMAVTGPPDAIGAAVGMWAWTMTCFGVPIAYTAHRELAWHSAAYPEVLARVATPPAAGTDQPST